MKNQKIGSVTPHFFEDSLIIPLSKEWVNHFNTIPSFKIEIDRSGRLHLISSTIRSVRNE